MQAIFGFAHYPLWGANAFIEACLGGGFAFAYWASGYDLFAPTVAHFIYDFVTILTYWFVAKTELEKNIAIITEAPLRALATMDSRQFNEMVDQISQAVCLNTYAFIPSSLYPFIPSSHHPIIPSSHYPIIPSSMLMYVRIYVNIICMHSLFHTTDI
jgi:hypothetical protein